MRLEELQQSAEDLTFIWDRLEKHEHGRTAALSTLATSLRTWLQDELGR